MYLCIVCITCFVFTVDGLYRLPVPVLKSLQTSKTFKAFHFIVIISQCASDIIMYTTGLAERSHYFVTLQPSHMIISNFGCLITCTYNDERFLISVGAFLPIPPLLNTNNNSLILCWFLQNLIIIPFVNTDTFAVLLLMFSLLIIFS